MKPLIAILRTLIALFISEGVLTLIILAVVATTAIVLKMSGSSLVAAVALVGGCLSALTLSVWRNAK